MSGHEDALSNSSGEVSVKKYTMSQQLLDALLAKGFSENAIKKSIVAGCIDEATCTQWVTMHDGHPELDTPLDAGVEVVVRVKRVLTAEEREAKVQELREKAKAKVEEEKRAAAAEEWRRMEMGRKALDTKEALEAKRREMELTDMQRQKEADAVARRKITIQIAADRYAREGLAPEQAWLKASSEFEAAAQRRRETAAAAAAAAAVQKKETPGEKDATGAWDLRVTQPIDGKVIRDAFEGPAPLPAEIPAIVDAMVQLADTAAAQESAALLRTILTNIRASPFDTAKRSLRTSTRAFGAKIAAVPPALQLLRACGFQLACDTSGNESVTASTVVIHVIDSALASLEKVK